MIDGVVGIGLELPPALGGQDVLNWPDAYFVEELNVRIRTGGNYGTPIDLTFAIDRDAWSGRIGVNVLSAATNDLVQDAAEFSIVFSGVPEPSSLVLLSFALFLIQRRR